MQTAMMSLFLPLSLALSACSLIEGDPEGDAALATQLLSERRIAEARLAINEAIKARDDDPEFYLISAQIELTAGSNEGAFNAFQNAMALDQTNINALLGVSQLGLQLGRLTDASNASERLLALNPRQTEALLVQGLIALVKRRNDEALALADQVLEYSPRDEAGTILKARVMFIDGDPNGAKDVIADFESVRGPTAGTARTRLEIARSQSDVAAMDAAFTQLRNLVPEDNDLKLDEANFRFKTGKTDAAKAIVLEVLADENAGPAQIEQGVQLLRSNAAPLDTQDASRASGFSPPARLTLAAAMIELDALEAADRLLAGLDDPRAIGLSARAALSRRDRADARRLSVAALRRDPDECQSLFVQGELARLSGQARLAVRNGQRAAAQCPQLVAAWRTTAVGYAMQDDPFNARRVFREGIAKNPQKADAAAQYADWLLTQGQERPAIAAARSVARAAPANEKGWRVLTNVCQRTGSRCAADAASGLAEARRSYWIDLRPGNCRPTDCSGG